MPHSFQQLQEIGQSLGHGGFLSSRVCGLALSAPVGTTSAFQPHLVLNHFSLPLALTSPPPTPNRDQIHMEITAWLYRTVLFDPLKTVR